MFPIIRIGEIALPSYPLLLLVALWVGMGYSTRRARELGLDGDHVYNAGLYGLIAGVVGARLWFVISHWENYTGDITQAFSLSRNALSTGGGLIVAGLVVLIYLQRNDIPLGIFADAAAPGLALGIAIGNVGAFLGGQGLGLPSDLAWAISIADTARHPVQLYEAGLCLIILAILYVNRGWRPWSSFHFWLFIALYGLVRLFLETLRARPYLIGDGFLGLQVLALVAIVVALAVMAYNFSSSPDKPQAETL